MCQWALTAVAKQFITFPLRRSHYLLFSLQVDLRELRNQVISLIEKDKMLGVVSSVGL